MNTSLKKSSVGSQYNGFFKMLSQFLFDKSLCVESTKEFIEVLIKADVVEKYFTSILDLKPIIEYYMEFSLSKIVKEDYKIYKLLSMSSYSPHEGLLLSFNSSALQIINGRQNGYSVLNIKTTNQFKSTSAQLIYNLCCEHSHYGKFSISPEQLKALFSVTYPIATLSERILKPAKEQMDELYSNGTSHVSFEYIANRSATGYGAKTVSMDFKIRNRFVEGYLESTKDKNLNLIKTIINNNFVYNGNIINAQIDFMSCYQIDSLYNRISNLSSHPDINILPLSDIIRHILLFEFGVKTDKIPALGELFVLPPTPRQYKEGLIKKRKKEIALKNRVDKN